MHLWLCTVQTCLYKNHLKRYNNILFNNKVYSLTSCWNIILRRNNKEEFKENQMAKDLILMKRLEILWFPFNLHQFRGHFRTKCAELWMWNLTSCDSLFLTGNWNVHRASRWQCCKTLSEPILTLSRRYPTMISFTFLAGSGSGCCHACCLPVKFM